MLPHVAIGSSSIGRLDFFENPGTLKTGPPSRDGGSLGILMFKRDLLSLTMCAGLAFLSGTALAEEIAGFQQPDISKLGFDASKIKLTPESKAAAARLLVSNVSEVDDVFDAKLIGLALVLDPQNADARQACVSLQNGTPLKRLQPQNPVASAKYFTDLGSYFRQTGGAENSKVGALLVNLALRLDYDNKRARQEAELLPPAEWTFVTGGEADSVEAAPAREVAEAYALSVLQKADYSRSGNRMELSMKCEPFEGGNLTFSSNIGEETKASAKNALRVLGSLRPSVPKRYKFDIKIGPKDDPVDGGSAGTAMTLLMYSLFDKVPVESSLAVTGEIMPNGTVGRVGGVAYKLKGAHSAGTKIVAVPLKNAEEVCDFALLASSDNLWDMHVFTYNSFPELLRIAHTQRPEQLAKAMALFDKTRSEYRADKSQGSKAYQALREVIKLAPNHASAIALSRLLSSPRPPQLSFTTSVGEINQLGWKFSIVLASAVRETAIPAEMIAELKGDLEALRRRADPKVASWISVMSDVVVELENTQDPTQLPGRVEASMHKLETLSATIDGALGKESILIQQERSRHGAK